MKKTYFMLLVSMFMLLVASSAFGAEWKEIKASGLKKMMETGDVLVVFPLSKIEFDDLHIKGSINIPMHELKEKLPKDKNKTVVFYCLGRR